MTRRALAASAHYKRRPHGTPQLWKFGQDVQWASQLAGNAALIRSRVAQFDGFCFQTPNHHPIRSTAMTLDDARSAFSSLSGVDFGTMKHAPMVYWFDDQYPSQNPWTVDADWTRIAQNFANYAQAAYEAGCSLLMFDNEAYGAWTTVPFPYDWPNCAPSLTLAQARTTARARGEQCMDAIRAAVPHVTICLLHPYGVSSPNYGTYLAPCPWNDVSAVHELNGVFHSGFGVSAAKTGSAATVIDGNEVYSIRGVPEFQKLCRWTKYPGRVIDDTTAPIAVARPFRETAGATLWDYDIRPEMDGTVPSGTAGAQTPAELKQNIVDSMRVAETYTILYTESHVTGDWWSAPGTLPPSEGFAGSITQAYLDAVAEAKIIGRGGKDVANRP